jgi:uncharacterized protein YukE
MLRTDGGGGTDVTIDVPPGDPASLYQLADTLDGYAAAVLNLGDNTLSTTSGIRGKAGWSGAAADAYSQFTGTTSGGIKSLQPHLTNIASSVRGFADTLDAAQQKVRTAITAANKTSQSGSDNPQTQIAAAQQAAAQAQSEVNAAGAKASAEVDDEKGGLEKFFEVIEPYRKANEWIHVPLDAIGEPLTKDLLKLLHTGPKAAEAAVDKLNEALRDQFDEQVSSVAHDFDHGEASMDDIQEAFAKYFVDTKGIDEDLGDATRALAGWEGGFHVLGGLAILGDAATVLDPEDQGAMGWVDRSAAGVNAAAVGTGMALPFLVDANTLDAVPVVGEVVMAADVGTGIYLAGDFLYHHFKPFHNVCNAVGGSVASAADATAHGVSKAAHSVAHFFDSL